MPSETPSGDGVYLTVYLSSCPNMDTVQYSSEWLSTFVTKTNGFCKFDKQPMRENGVSSTKYALLLIKVKSNPIQHANNI